MMLFLISLNISFYVLSSVKSAAVPATFGFRSFRSKPHIYFRSPNLVKAQLLPKMIPRCARDNKILCPVDGDYPIHDIEVIISQAENPTISNVPNQFYNVQSDSVVITGSQDVGMNSQFPGSFICEADHSIIRPGWAKHASGKWLTIVNTDRQNQTVRQEVCRHENQRCGLLPQCLESRCVQRYAHVKMLSIDMQSAVKLPKWEVFEVPTACSCFVLDVKV